MIEVKPLRRCDAAVRIPGSKSYTHRALIASSLAEGESLLVDALCCQDTERTREGLEAFGAGFSDGQGLVRVEGTGGNLRPNEEEINVGNSGTSMRFLAAMAALKKGRTVLDGSERMRHRPMGALVSALSGLGVRAYSQEEPGYPPVIVESKGLRGGVARIRSDESSQFLSALLMAAPYAHEGLRLEVSGPLASRHYVQMTLSVMAAFGVDVQQESDGSYFVQRGQRYQPRTYRIEGDASTASYFLSAAAITRGKVKVENFPSGLVQGDSAFLSILEGMGCKAVRGGGHAEVQGGKLRAGDFDMGAMPDLVPALAVTAAFAEGETEIRSIGHLRLKESDRVSALAEELTRMGIEVKEGRDWLKIKGGRPHGAEIDPHDDHRLAMAFAVAGLAVPGLRIRDEGCVAKSFPGFWEEFQKLYG